MQTTPNDLYSQNPATYVVYVVCNQIKNRFGLGRRGSNESDIFHSDSGDKYVSRFRGNPLWAH
jgi:hypothetical protein